MKYLAALLLALLPACASTPEDADRQARFLYAIAGGLESSAQTTPDPDLADELVDIANGARTLAGLVRANALEDDEKIVAYIGEVRQVIYLVMETADDQLRARLEAVDVVLGALSAYYGEVPATP